MKKQTIILVWILSVIFLSGCTSMGFMPPKFSLATADYVEKTVSKNTEKTAEEAAKKAETVIEEKISEQKEQIQKVIQDFKNQQENTKKILASMEDITKKSQSIDYQFRKMLEDIQNSKRETQDNLDEISDTLTVSLMKLSKLINDNTQTLKIQDQKFSNIIEQLQTQVNSTPGKTLEGLQKAIDVFLKEDK
ncbi:MAG: hypothetical protein U9R41_06730 [Candidatus Marinimicrobia bacterium]|nr:hypothetical protein [Candidatus Neomarinimicrobiota bacterium]